VPLGAKVVAPHDLALRAHIEKGRTVTGHRQHQEVAIQEQISHLAARLRDQQAAVASGAVCCTMPITATLRLSFRDMARSFVFGAPSPAWRAGAELSSAFPMGKHQAGLFVNPSRW
jgi:hypothetical protein